MKKNLFILIFLLFYFLHISNSAYALKYAWNKSFNHIYSELRDIKWTTFEESIMRAYDNWLIKWYSDKTFKPNSNVSFIESLKIIIWIWPNARKVTDYSSQNNQDWSIKYKEMYNSLYYTNESVYIDNNSFINRNFAVYLMLKQIGVNFTTSDYQKIPHSFKDIDSNSSLASYVAFANYAWISWWYSDWTFWWLNKITRWELITMSYKTLVSNKDVIIQKYNEIKLSNKIVNFIEKEVVNNTENVKDIWSILKMTIDSEKKYNDYMTSILVINNLNNYDYLNNRINLNIPIERMSLFVTAEKTIIFLYNYKTLLQENPNIQLPAFLTPLCISFNGESLEPDPIKNIPIEEDRIYSNKSIISKDSKIYQTLIWKLEPRKYWDDLVQEVYDLLIKRWLSPNDWKVITTTSVSKITWKIVTKKELVYEKAKLKDWTYVYKWSDVFWELKKVSSSWTRWRNFWLNIYWLWSVYNSWWEKNDWNQQTLNSLLTYAIQDDPTIKEIAPYLMDSYETGKVEIPSEITQ